MLAAVVAAVEKHDKMLTARRREHETASIAERVAAIYEEVRKGRRFAVATYNQRLKEAFAEARWDVPEARLKPLRLSATQIKNEKGPMDAAMLGVGAVLGVAQRAGYRAKKAGLPLLAYGSTTGVRGVLPYMLSLLGWGDRTAPTIPPGWTQSEQRAGLVLLGVGEARIDELLAQNVPPQAG